MMVMQMVMIMSTMSSYRDYLCRRSLSQLTRVVISYREVNHNCYPNDDNDGDGDANDSEYYDSICVLSRVNYAISFATHLLII